MNKRPVRGKMYELTQDAESAGQTVVNLRDVHTAASSLRRDCLTIVKHGYTHYGCSENGPAVCANFKMPLKNGTRSGTR